MKRPLRIHFYIAKRRHGCRRANPFRFFVASFKLRPVFKVAQSRGQKVSHNIPAVYDVFAVAIKETVGFRRFP